MALSFRKGLGLLGTARREDAFPPSGMRTTEKPLKLVPFGFGPFWSRSGTAKAVTLTENLQMKCNVATGS